MFMHRHLLCCWQREFAMTSVVSWQTSVSLCPASFCILRPNLPVTPGISWLPMFFLLYDKKAIFFLVLVLEGHVGLHSTIQFQLLQHYSSNEYSGLTSFRIDWFHLVAVQGTQRVFSNTTVQKHQFFSGQLSSWSKSHIHT